MFLSSGIPRTPGRGRRLAACVACLPLAVAFLAAPWVLAGPADAVKVRVRDATPGRITLECSIGELGWRPVVIGDAMYTNVLLGEEPPRLVAGAPELPTVRRSIIIPDDARMEVKVLSSEHYEIPNVRLAPSQGALLRSVDPAAMPFVFGKEYQTDAFYPPTLVSLGRPYIMRDLRGLVVEINPLRYNPATQTLRVYTTVTVQVMTVGPGLTNVLRRGSRERAQIRDFDQIQRRQFLNYAATASHEQPAETGDLLIIYHDPWLTNIQPLIDHKQRIGVHTTAVPVSAIGNNAASIKSYIQSVYDSSDLAFVLLVGDAAQVATPTVETYKAADPTYALLAGDDHYPEILVGRFSAETAAEVDTQVQRTIEYELLPAANDGWFRRGAGIASDEGAGYGDDGETDWQHLDNIRTDLLGYGYTTVDQLYEPTATKAQVSAALNGGRRLVNYCGHGSSTSWGTTGFSNADVNALTNDNLLPFIFSVACSNGQFREGTCFAEAWLRATHNGEPTGAVATYMASATQYWAPPMSAQDQFVDLYVAEALASFGGLCVAGSARMMDEYGVYGDAMFDIWHVFGDPSLAVRGLCSNAGVVTLDRPEYACAGVANITVIDCGLNRDGNVVEQATVTIASTSEPSGESVTLTETAPGSARFEGSITVSGANAAGVLWVMEGDSVTVTYVDADDGRGGFNVSLTDSAVVDCTPPLLVSVEATDVLPHSATIIIDADEPIRGFVHYGGSCAALTGDAAGRGYADPAAVQLDGLRELTTYFYSIELEDEAGNRASYDNGGACYVFSTSFVPNYFTEEFFGDADLSNMSLTFTPTASADFYSGCVEPITELPVDPQGGVALAGPTAGPEGAICGYGAATLLGGATVALYGQRYSSFYFGTHGFATFTEAQANCHPSLDGHFETPRVSAFFHDADVEPSSGMTVSWDQLGDRAVVTWAGAPNSWDPRGPNTFQLELFFDGVIRMSYLTVGGLNGVVGLSRGLGVPADFEPTDLSAIGSCAPVGAGQTPNQADWPGTPLEVSRAANGDLTLTWGPSCLEGDNDYEIYEGALGAFASHSPRFCNNEHRLTKTFAPGAGGRYYLVVPRNAFREGSYGRASSGAERPPAQSPCLPQQISACP